MQSVRMSNHLIIKTNSHSKTGPVNFVVITFIVALVLQKVLKDGMLFYYSRYWFATPK